MTRKPRSRYEGHADFIALADILRNHHKRSAEISRSAAISEDQPTKFFRTLAWNQLTKDIADFCAEQNPRFDHEKWLEYLCGCQQCRCR